jgi:hypothetical protein
MFLPVIGKVFVRSTTTVGQVYSGTNSARAFLRPWTYFTSLCLGRVGPVVPLVPSLTLFRIWPSPILWLGMVDTDWHHAEPPAREIIRASCGVTHNEVLNKVRNAQQINVFLRHISFRLKEHTSQLSVSNLRDPVSVRAKPEDGNMSRQKDFKLLYTVQ